MRPTANEKLNLARRPVKRLVSFTRYYGGRVKRLDGADNLPGTCKPVLDFLVLKEGGLGLIFDDRDEWCATCYEQVEDRNKAGRLRVEVGVGESARC